MAQIKTNEENKRMKLQKWIEKIEQSSQIQIQIQERNSSSFE
jgi:hypothetical protein